jgi:hypothetical protein
LRGSLGHAAFSSAGQSKRVALERNSTLERLKYLPEPFWRTTRAGSATRPKGVTQSMVRQRWAMKRPRRASTQAVW